MNANAALKSLNSKRRNIASLPVTCRDQLRERTTTASTPACTKAVQHARRTSRHFGIVCRLLERTSPSSFAPLTLVENARRNICDSKTRALHGDRRAPVPSRLSVGSDSSHCTCCRTCWCRACHRRRSVELSLCPRRCWCEVRGEPRWRRGLRECRRRSQCEDCARTTTSSPRRSRSRPRPVSRTSLTAYAADCDSGVSVSLRVTCGGCCLCVSVSRSSASQGQPSSYLHEGHAHGAAVRLQSASGSHPQRAGCVAVDLAWREPASTTAASHVVMVRVASCRVVSRRVRVSQE
jgi:hypothetical protein